MFETLHVTPVSYKLDMTEEQLKKLTPFFKVSSGSSSRITKTIQHPQQGDPKLEDQVTLAKKEKGSVTVELWNGNSSRPENLIGKGEISYDSLSNIEGKFEEWTPLYKNGKQIGKALIQVEVKPVKESLPTEDFYNMNIEDMDRSFKRAIENMNNSFRNFNNFMLPSSEPLTEGIIMRPPRSLFDNTLFGVHDMFARALEDMHNTFDQFTRDVMEGRKFDDWNTADAKKHRNDKDYLYREGELHGLVGKEIADGLRKDQIKNGDKFNCEECEKHRSEKDYVYREGEPRGLVGKEIAEGLVQEEIKNMKCENCKCEAIYRETALHGKVGKEIMQGVKHSEMRENDSFNCEEAEKHRKDKDFVYREGELHGVVGKDIVNGLKQ